MNLSLSAAGSIAAVAGSAIAQPFPAQFELSSLLPANGGTGAAGFVLTGIDMDDRCGFSATCAGDVNGDGFDDLIIGAYGASPNGVPGAGETYVVFGGPGVGAGGVVDLSTLNGVTGFVCNGSHAGDTSGRCVSGAGDVNGDGIDDLVIGASSADPSGRLSAGVSYVVFGSPSIGAGGSIELASLDGTSGFALLGVDERDFSGEALSGAGDVNSDGYADLIIGALGGDPNGALTAGESYVVFGGPGIGATGSIELAILDGSSGFVINGIHANGQCGSAVSTAGDANGDGIDDLIIGARYAQGIGECYVVFGGAGIGSTGSLELSILDGANGYLIPGIDPIDRTGRSVASAGDVNGDGWDDLIIGARGGDPNGHSGAGESYVVFGGPPVGATGVVSLSALNGENGFVCNGIDPFDSSGHMVSSAGDVNGDGFGDVIIGTWQADPNGNSDAGESYVVFGGPSAGGTGVLNLSTLDGANGFVLAGVSASDFSGFSVSRAGDVNGDGTDDLMIGAYAADPNGQSRAGEVYVVFGRAAVPVPCVGDLTGDGVVNSADFTIFASNFGATVTPNTNGDFTGDGLVNSADFNILASDFGCGAP